MSEFGVLEVVERSGDKIVVRDDNTGAVIYLDCAGMSKRRAVNHAEEFMSYVILGSAFLSKCKIGSSADGAAHGVMLSSNGAVGEGIGADIADAAAAAFDCIIDALGSTAAYASTVYHDFRDGKVIDGIKGARYNSSGDDDKFFCPAVLDYHQVEGGRFRFLIGDEEAEISWDSPADMPLAEAMIAAQHVATRWAAGGEAVRVINTDVIDGAWVAHLRGDSDVGIRVDGGESEAVAKMLRVMELATAAHSMTAVVAHSIATEGNGRVGPRMGVGHDNVNSED